jgi:hypothetical protein
VEGLVGYTRRNFFVPLPRVNSFGDLNLLLRQRCQQRRRQQLRGHGESIGQRLLRDQQAFFPLPAALYEACETIATRVSSLSLVRYRTNDYSVPTAYGHRDVVVKGYVDHVVIGCGSEIIARHIRSYEREDFIFEPLHYLALLEQKSNALDQAAPLEAWELPKEFLQLRRLLEVRLGKNGKREYIQVLRLLECFPQAAVEHAVREALRLQAISFDGVKHLLLCSIEGRPARLDLQNYPHLPEAQVAITAASDYLSLLTQLKPAQLSSAQLSPALPLKQVSPLAESSMAESLMAEALCEGGR